MRIVEQPSMGTPDVLVAEQIQAALPNARIGRQITVLPEVGSTNDFLREVVTSATPEGLVVCAEHQTAGRGQRGNQWESAAGKGLWFSVLLRPRLPVDQSYRLTDWAAETVAGALQKQFDLPAKVKLPNDVYVNDRKIAGVLAEMVATTGSDHVAILGIGVNLNHAREDFSEALSGHAISVAMISGEKVDRNAFTVVLLRDLDLTYRTRFAA